MLVAVPSNADNVFLPATQVSNAFLKSVKIGDVTGDGRDDLVLSGEGGAVYGRVDVYVQTAAGTLDGPHTYNGHDDFTHIGDGSLALGDVTGDGRNDVVVSLLGGIGVLPQRSDGTLGPVMNYGSSTLSYVVIAVGDLNGDGKSDVLAKSDTPPHSPVVLFPQTASGTLGAPVNVGCPMTLGGGIGDLNGDRLLDIVIGDQTSLCWVLQQPGGGFGAPTIHKISAPGTYPDVQSLAVGDVNGDGRADIVAGIEDGTRLYTLYQLPSGAFDTPSIIPVGGAPNQIVIRDVTQDGIGDALVFEDTSIVVHRGTKGPFPALVSGPAGSQSPSTDPNLFAVGDLNGDGLPDAADTLQIYYGTAADLRLSVHHDPEPVLAGGKLVYTVTITNAGPDPTDDVVLDYTDGGITSLLPTKGCTGTGPGPCSLGTLAASSTATVTLEATAETPGTYVPHFSVSAYAFDPDVSNNAADDPTTVLPSADVSVSMLGGAAGPNMNWLLTVANAGPIDAENVHAELTLPGGLTISGVGADQGTCTTAGSTIACELGTIPHSLGNKVSIQVNTQGDAGSYKATAKASSTTPDPDSTNNETDYTIDVGGSGYGPYGGPLGSGDTSDACACCTGRESRAPSAAGMLGIALATAGLRARRRRGCSAALGDRSTPLRSRVRRAAG